MQPRSLPDTIPTLRPVNDTEEGLIRGCLEFPWDDARFLIFADWLEENDQVEVSDYVRSCLNWADYWRRPPVVVQRYWESRVGERVARNAGYLRGFPSVLNITLMMWLLYKPEAEGLYWGLHLKDALPDSFIEFLASERLANYSALSFDTVRSTDNTLTLSQLFSSRRVMNRINGLDHLCAFKLTDALLGQLNTELLLQSIQFRQLESLGLQGNLTHSPQFLFHPDWQHLRTIRSLDLAANQMEIYDLFLLTGFRLYPNLQYLRLSWNQISINTDLTDEPLFPELQELHLVGGQLNNGSVKALSESKHFPKLRSLDLSSNPEVSILAIFELLKTDNFPRLRVIHLTGLGFHYREKNTLRSLATEKNITLLF